MLRYAIVEIAGRQYKASPGRELTVNHLGAVDDLECDKVLAIASDDKLEIGKPYLKSKLTVKAVGVVRGPKSRVAKFHAKANTRRVIGSRNNYSKITLKEA